MKHLIIEGPDRTGKDSLITGLLPYCQNAVITHFSSPIGETDAEKRAFQEKSFSREFSIASQLRHSEIFTQPKPSLLNILFWNRAHLGEFVYGKLYRETNPEEWVMKIEEEFHYDKEDEIYLLLLTGDPEFLSSRDDGLSFDSSVEARKREIANFRNAFNLSKIKKKLEIKVNKTYTPKLAIPDKNMSPRQVYIDREEIINTVLQFIKS